MNVEKLFEIAESLQADFQKTQVVQKIQAVVSNLQNIVNQPNQNHSQSLGTNLTGIYQAIDKSKIEDFSPGWKQFLMEIGLFEFTGDRLRQTIKGIFERNQITPVIALQEMQAIFQKMNAISNGVESTLSGFRSLGLEKEALDVGECEFGIVMPRVAVDNDLRRFQKECHEMVFILDTFSEFTTGKKEKLEVKTISSSDFILYLLMLPTVAAMLTKSIDWILAKYKELLEIKKLRTELQRLNVPEEKSKGIEEYTNDLMESSIDQLVEEMFRKRDGKNPHRDNELKNSMRIALNKLANRIDRGFNFEVRISIASSQEVEDGSPEKEILERAENLKFIKTEGDPILRLSEDTEKTKEKKTTAKGAEKA